MDFTHANWSYLPANYKWPYLFQRVYLGAYYPKFREMIIEGIVSIAEGENPRNIETKLQGYVH